MPANLEQRIGKLESALAKTLPPSVSGCGPWDQDAAIQKFESWRLLAKHTDPLVRLKCRREKIQEAEQTLLTKEKSVTGHAIAEFCLPIDHHSARDAELEMLERAGFDTGELRAKHQQHTSNPYKWPYRDNPLPSEAQAILDRITCTNPDFI